MTSFEIKIFANPTGYDELKLNSKSELFTDELITRRSFDSDGDSFPDGAFSVFYTSEIYIITYHFDVVTEAGFRAPRVHFAVAIRRGFKMENPVDVFNELKIEFNKFAAVQRATGIRGIYTKTTDFEAIIVPHIKRDPDQLCINSETSNDLTRSVVAYKTTEQLECLLEEPMRQKFKFKTGMGILMILEYQAANQVWPKIKDKYSSISLDAAEYKFTCKYELVFPDKHIKTIKSRNEEIDYVCEKSFYKPYYFKGNLLEHFTEWKITQSADRTQFIIGLSLESEVKVWKLQFVNSDDGSMLAKPIPLKTSLGVIEGNTLILKGDEIGNINDLLLTSVNPQWMVMDRLSFIDEEIQVLIKQRMLYNLAPIFQYITEKYNFSPVITLYSKNNSKKPLDKFDQDNLRKYVDLPYNEAFILIAESEKFKANQLPFNQNGGFLPFILEKKAISTLNFEIVNEKVKRRMSEGKMLICHYDVNKEHYDKALTLDDCKISELPEGTTIKYCLEFPGYKVNKGKVEISKIPKTVSVHFQSASLTIAYRIFKAVWLYIFMLVLGVYLGFSSANTNFNPVAWKKNRSITNDSLSQARDTIGFLRDTIAGLKENIKDITDEKHKLDTLYQNLAKGLEREKIEKNNLEKTLKTCTYKKEDIDALKKIDSENKIARDAEICLNVINTKGDKKKELEKYINRREFGTFYKGVLKKINNNENWKKAYLSCRRHDFKTIQEALKAFSESSN